MIYRCHDIIIIIIIIVIIIIIRGIHDAPDAAYLQDAVALRAKSTS